MEQSEPTYKSRVLEELVRDTNPDKLNMVTGPFSYSGRYITERVLRMGERVRGLTGHLEKKPVGSRVEAFPYNFNKPEKLIESLDGVDTFYKTYWIRVSYREMTFDKAVDNSKILIDSAKEAGVKRIVYISITNADEESPFPYFRGKGTVERFIRESGLGYAILCPALIFGKENVLINNIAWFLRRYPVFGVFGDGNYRLQPIYVEDLAKLAVDVGHMDEDMIIDAIGPETFTFNELVHLIKDKIGSNAKILHLPPWLPLTFSKIVGKFVNDIVVTKDEVDGLMQELLYSPEPPRGKTKFSSWLEENSESIGTEYISQLKMHYL